MKFIYLFSSLVFLTACNFNRAVDFFSETLKQNSLQQNSQEEEITKEAINSEALKTAQKAVWELKNYLISTENKITITQKVENNQTYDIANIKEIAQEILLSHGSGFFISPTHMITNFHVIHNIDNNTKLKANRDLENESVLFRSMKVLKVSAIYDLALVQSTTKVDSYLNIQEFPIHPKRDSFFLIGYPDNRFIMSSIDYYSSQLNQRIFAFYRDSKLGNLKGSSGGPIVDQNGQVVGVNYGSSSNLTHAISNFTLNDFLDGNNRDCKDLPIEECIDKEWLFLEESSTRDSHITKHRVLFNGNYTNWLTKRDIFKDFVKTKNELTTLESSLFNHLNKLKKNNTESNRIQYKQTVEEYNLTVDVYNQLLKKLNNFT